MSSFDLADVLAEYSRAVRLSLIAIESLHGVPGIDNEKISAVAQSVRHSHAHVTAYIATLIEASSAAERQKEAEARGLAAGTKNG